MPGMSTAVSSVSASDYLSRILAREVVDRRSAAGLEDVANKIELLCTAWGGEHIVEVVPGGAYRRSSTPLNIRITRAETTLRPLHSLTRSTTSSVDTSSLPGRWPQRFAPT